jgi:hypothetical protein
MASITRALALATSLAVALAHSPLPAAAATPAAPLTRQDYEACQARDEPGFRSAVQTITSRALALALDKVDYDGVVGQEWRQLKFDELLDRRVDVVIAEVTAENSLITLGTSVFSKETATDLATKVAERVFRADDVKTGIEALATGATRQLGRSIEVATLDAAEPTLLCLRTFLGPRYGQTVAGAVSLNAAQLFEVDPAKAKAGVTTAGVAAQGSEAIAGAALIIVRRQLARISQRVGQRIVGSILGRVVGSVAGGIGVILIAKDIWEYATKGVMPVIGAEMKSKATKDLLRGELAKALREQIGGHTDEIAAATTDEIIKIWREFQQAHAKVLELADKHEGFRRFLDLTRPDRLARLDEIVAIVLAGEGEAGVLARLGNGTLDRAVNRLDQAGFDIARDTRSLAAALEWETLAGPDLGKVAALEIHRRAKAADFTRPALTRLLKLDDRLAVTRLTSLQADARIALLELGDKDLVAIARALGDGELAVLSRYLTALPKPAVQRLLQAVAASPGQLQRVTAPRIRDAILTSKDADAAVAMMLQAGGPLEPGVLVADVRLVVDGRVQPLLLWEKHPSMFAVAGAIALFVLLLLGRLLFGRRRRRAAPVASA